MLLNLCVQDDSNPNTVVLINFPAEGYRCVCNGATYTGGMLTVRGSTFRLDHNCDGQEGAGDGGRVGTTKFREHTRATGDDWVHDPGQNTQDNNCVCK